MTNSTRMQVRLPAALERELRALAKLAGLSLESVIKIVLATEVRRWQLERVEDGERE